MFHLKICSGLVAAAAMLASPLLYADPVSGAPDASSSPSARMVAGGKLPSSLPDESSSLDITTKMANLLVTAKENGEVMRLYGNWKSGDKAAIGQIFAAARNGNARAQNLAGYMLDNGEGVKQDSKAAASYFEHAATQVPLARYNLGLLYYYGRGVPRDQARAADLFKKSAVSAGVVQACVLLSLYYLQNRDEEDAYKWANEGSNRGNIKAFYLLGRILYQRRQFRDARMWIEKAASASEPNAPAILSRMYTDGSGIDRNSVMGAAWWLIYTGLNRNHLGSGVAAISSFGLAADDQRRATAFANNWLSTHTESRRVDYRKSLLQSS